MGQKVHPLGFRLGIHRGWASNWIATGPDAKDLPAQIAEDSLIREFVMRELAGSGISKIELSRKPEHITIDIYTARPGVVVGKGGAGLETLNQKIRALLHRKSLDIRINVLEIAKVDLEAKLVSESIAQQLEKRVAFRRAMKQAMQRCMRAGAHGVKVMVAGRLGGAEIARTEWAKEGRIPLQTLRADIDYGLTEAHTTMGKIGVKVWVFRGELDHGQWSPPNIKVQTERSQQQQSQEPGNRPDRGAGRAGKKSRKAG